MAKKATLADVAEAAGVSVFTVSQAINERPGLAPQTREKVLRVADELSYIPNRSARELRRPDRSQVAVLAGGSSNAYYIDMIRGVTRVVQRHRRTLLMMDIASEGVYDAETEDAVVKELIRTGIAGVISTLVLRPESLALFEKWGVPVVFVDSSPRELNTQVGYFGTDNLAAGHQVGRYLVNLGLHDWLFAAYPSTWSTREPREQGLRDAAKILGANLHVIESANNPMAAAEAIQEYLITYPFRPDVLIAGNNPILQGALQALRYLELRIPEDIAVFAYDEFPWAPLVAPAITVLDEHAEGIGEAAAECLMRIINEQVQADERREDTKPVFTSEDHVLAPTTIIARHSCGEQPG